jgi:hypothetical protein
MATAPLIPLLDAPLFRAAADQDQFTRIVSEQLGDLAGPADGFEAEILELAALADAAASVIPSIDPDLVDAEAVATAFDIDEETPLAVELAAAIADGDTELGLFDGELIPPPPTPPTPVTPPAGNIGPGIGAGVEVPPIIDKNAPITCITNAGDIGVLVGGDCMPLIT